MRRIPYDELKPGMIIARTVLDIRGNALLTKGTKLTNRYIDKLREKGLGSIYIQDGIDDIDVPEIISEQLRSSLTIKLNNSLKNLASGKTINMIEIRKSVNVLLDNIISNRNTLIQLEDIRSYDDYLFMHSINVAIFAMMTGRSLGYSETDLVELGLGALLHDIGMIALNPAILNQTRSLNQLENEHVKSHAEIGFNILRSYREVSVQAAHIAYQHHERVDGQGYPRSLKAAQIHEYAKIVAVVDTFDAIISDRPFRSGYTITDALKIVKKLSGSYFDARIVDAFASNVAMYPMGSIVELNSGDLAVVVAVNKYRSHCPIIRIIGENVEIDLGKASELSISRRLSYQEIEVLDRPKGIPVHSSIHPFDGVKTTSINGSH